jgi:hypothetical protein
VFSCVVSIFSLFQIVKEQYLKHDSIKSSLRFFGSRRTGDNVFHSLSDGVPKGIRTPVTAVKGQCPRPLDDGDTKIAGQPAADHFCAGALEFTTRHRITGALAQFHSSDNLLWTLHNRTSLGKEVIQPQVPLRLPCYDFTPVMNHKVVSALPKVKLPTSFATHSHGVTGGVYKARERIHRGILIHDY